MVQLYDRAGQQVEIERTSFISFCDEGEVKAKFQVIITQINQLACTYFQLRNRQLTNIPYLLLICMIKQIKTNQTYCCGY